MEKLYLPKVMSGEYEGLNEAPSNMNLANKTLAIVQKEEYMKVLKDKWIEEPEKLSNCCSAKIIEEKDICSKCKEHCDIEEVQNEEKGIHGNINIIDTSAVGGIDNAVMSMKNEEYGREDIEGENYLKLTLKMSEEEHNNSTPKEPEKEWKEEFDKKFPNNYCERVSALELRKQCKQFIQSLLSQKDKEVEEVLIWTLNNIKAFEDEWTHYRGEKTKGEYLIQRYHELVR